MRYTRPNVAQVDFIKVRDSESPIVRAMPLYSTKMWDLNISSPLLQLDAENDRAISEHVLRGHRFRKPGSDMEPEQLNGTSAEGAGQQEQTESPEEAAQVTPDLLVLLLDYFHVAARHSPSRCSAGFHVVPMVLKPKLPFV